MCYTLSPMPRPPEQKGIFKEHQPLPYYLAASFLTKAESQAPYDKAQEISFHFERKPHDPKMPPLSRPWFVVVLGEQPPEPIERQLRGILGSGEMTTLSLETVVTLAKRRSEEISKRPWTEMHYGEGKIMPEATIKFRRKPKGKRPRRR
jgi:hypothetical protein